MSSSSAALSPKVAVPALVLAVGGAVASLASLWMSWAVADTTWGAAPRRSGWSWMAYGDVLLVVACAAIVFVAAEICLRPRFHAVALGIGAVLLSVCAIAGALVVVALTGITFADFDTVDYGVGPGPTVAIAGLLVAAAGVVVAMIGAAPHDRSLLAHVHLPHPFQHSH